MLRSLASRLRRLSSKGNSKNLGWRQVISLLVYYTACFWHPSLFRLQSENGGHRWCWLQCHCWRYKAIRGIQHANTICMALTWWTKSLISWLSRLSDHGEWIPFVSCVFYHCTSCDNPQISLVYICPPNEQHKLWVWVHWKRRVNLVVRAIAGTAWQVQVLSWGVKLSRANWPNPCLKAEWPTLNYKLKIWYWWKHGLSKK